MAWEAFNWGSRGLWYKTGVEGIYMGAIRVADGIRIVIEAESIQAGKMLHTIHSIVTSAPPVYADCEAVASAVKDWINTDYVNMVPTDIRFRRVVATGMNAIPSAQASVDAVFSGVRAGVPLAHTLTCSIRLGTRSSGRREHGWVMAFSGVQSDNNADRYTDGYITALQGVWQNLANRMFLAGYPLCIFSSRDGKVKRVKEIQVLDNLVDSADSRRAERGR